jgi:hypothetical protein
MMPACHCEGYPQFAAMSGPSGRNRYSKSDLDRFSIQGIEADRLPESAKTLEIPIDSRYKIVVLYLTRSDCVDRIVEQRKLVTHEISRS